MKHRVRKWLFMPYVNSKDPDQPAQSDQGLLFSPRALLNSDQKIQGLNPAGV